MSGLGCVLHADSTPVDPGDLRRMLAASSTRGPDGVYSWTDAGVALGFLSFRTTPDAAAAAQPLVDRSRRLAVVFDGRLDNRDDLCTELGSAVPTDVADVQFVLEAFAQWGVDAPARLLGDFACIVWDGARRRVIAARDHMGVRPLHFHERSGSLVCATDVLQVLAHPLVPRAPDTETAADYLSLAARNTPRTLYRGVCRLPAGHMLIAEAGRLRVLRYWTPEPRAAIRYRRDDEYAEHCRDLLIRSVRARLRSDRPVAALLSGGLDSSSVVAVATRALSAGDRLPATFSMIFPGRPEADEREFIIAVARHCGITPVMVRPRPLEGGAVGAHAARWLDCPGFASDLAVRPLYDAIRDGGHRTVLTGCGGDYLFAGSVFQYADLLREWKVLAALRQCRADMYTDATGWDRLALVRAGLWPLLPVAMKRALRPVARRISGFRGRPRWLRLEASSPDGHPAEPRGGSFATEAIARDLGGGLYTLFLESGERALADVPLEARHPFLDVRLIDFALSIPEEQRRRGTWLKFVLRSALRDDLPADVARRRSKADFGYVIAEALESLGGARFFRSLRIAQCGWVDGAALARTYEFMRRRFDDGDARYGDDLPSLWIVAALELWYSAAFDARDRARYHMETSNGTPQPTIVHRGRT